MVSKITPKLVYCAGPYRARWPWQKAANILRAIRAAVQVARKGHIPFCPHAHTCLWWLFAWGATWRFFIDIDLPILERCDWLLLLAHSPGADVELALAEARGMAVFYSVDEVPEVTR